MRCFLPIMMIATLVSCDAIKPQTQPLELDGPKWVLTAINHKPVSGESRAYLEFNDKLEVQGKAFCNSIKADYELMGKDQLTFQAITSTKMFCDGVMNLENEMITNLENVKRYEIKSGMLYLSSSDAVLLTFKK